MRHTIPALLLASSLLPVTALAAPPAAADAHVPAVRISTGVSHPVLLNGSHVSISQNALELVPFPAPMVELSMHVDEKGTPNDVRVIKSVTPKVDAQVLAAARAFRFRPAMLDHQPVGMDMRLMVNIQR